MAILRIRNEFELQDVIDELGEPPELVVRDFALMTIAARLTERFPDRLCFKGGFVLRHVHCILAIMPSVTNTALMQLHRRAEASDAATLVETFVDVGPLFTLLSSRDHQVLYGRRGTGKTHALTYLRAHVRDRGDFASMIDLRTIGSTGGLYGDASLPLAVRARAYWLTCSGSYMMT